MGGNIVLVRSSKRLVTQFQVLTGYLCYHIKLNSPPALVMSFLFVTDREHHICSTISEQGNISTECLVPMDIQKTDFEPLIGPNLEWHQCDVTKRVITTCFYTSLSIYLSPFDPATPLRESAP